MSRKAKTRIGWALIATSLFLGAWGAVIWLTGASIFTIALKAAPSSPISLAVVACEGANTGARTCVITGGDTLEVSTSDFDDTSSVSSDVQISNSSGTPAFFDLMTTPGNPCFTDSVIPSGTVSVPAGGNATVQFALTGNSESIACAGGTETPTWTFQVDNIAGP